MAKKKNFSVQGETVSNVSELCNKKKFHPHDLISFNPTESQKKFFKAFHEDVPIIVQDGPAGTGKTFCALYAALSLVFDESSPYHKIIVIRSAVETRGVGFLPGTLEEKAEAYENPYKTLISKMTKYNNTYDYIKQLSYFEFMLTSYLRGDTFDNTIVILDEAQNLDYSEASTVVTRLGEFSRLLVVGDSRQEDLSRKKQVSGFEQLKKVFNNMPYESTKTITYTLDDIVRSGIVKEFLKSEYQLI